MKKVYFSLIMFVMMNAVLVLTACSGDDDIEITSHSLVGEWQAEKYEHQIIIENNGEEDEDGHYIIYNPDLKIIFYEDGRYEFKGEFSHRTNGSYEVKDNILCFFTKIGDEELKGVWVIKKLTSKQLIMQTGEGYGDGYNNRIKYGTYTLKRVK